MESQLCVIELSVAVHALTPQFPFIRHIKIWSWRMCEVIQRSPTVFFFFNVQFISMTLLKLRQMEINSEIKKTFLSAFSHPRTQIQLAGIEFVADIFGVKAQCTNWDFLSRFIRWQSSWFLVTRNPHRLSFRLKRIPDSQKLDSAMILSKQCYVHVLKSVQAYCSLVYIILLFRKGAYESRNSISMCIINR